MFFGHSKHVCPRDPDQRVPFPTAERISSSLKRSCSMDNSKTDYSKTKRADCVRNVIQLATKIKWNSGPALYNGISATQAINSVYDPSHGLPL